MDNQRMLRLMGIAAAALLAALGTAASMKGSGRIGRAKPDRVAARQMGQEMMGQGGMTGQRRMAKQEEIQRLVGELLANQREMERTRTRRAMQPLLLKNRKMLEQLRDAVGGPREMGGGMSGRMSSGMNGTSAATQKPRAAKTANSATRRQIAEGRKIYESGGCITCHGVHGEGKIGPRLIGIGKKYSAAKIASLIRNPTKPAMPSYPPGSLPEAQLKAVVAYLESLR